MSRAEALLEPAEIVARLGERGATASSPLAALDALEPRWGDAPALEAAVAAWLGREGDQAAGARLAALESRTRDKSVKKEIKRSLHRLESRGLWSRPAAGPPPSARELLGPTESEPEAWLTDIDPSGTRLLWLARRAGDGVASLSAVINDVAGLLELHAGETTRKALRQAHRDLVARSRVALVEAPWTHVDALLEEAYERSADREKFADLPRARRYVVPERPSETAHPIDALLDRDAVASDAAALASSGDLLRAGRVAPWLLPPDWLAPVGEGLEAAQSSLVVVSPAHQEERARAAAEQGLEDALAAPERRGLFARRFEESAYLHAKRGDLAGARALLAAAIATAAGRRLTEIPILDELARLSLAYAVEARAERAREEARSSLIVTPAQAIAEQRARTRQR